MYPVLGLIVTLDGSLSFIDDCFTDSASIGSWTRIGLKVSP